MARSRVSLLLLVYVTLDFGNPLMPGAVTFDDGGVHMVQADRARPTAFVPICSAPTPEIVVERPDEAQTFRRPSPAVDPRGLAVVRTRRAPLPSSDPARPTEDH